jgi:hypothetical protein
MDLIYGRRVYGPCGCAAVDAGYRLSRITADTPINTQGATFGFGYRF